MVQPIFPARQKLRGDIRSSERIAARALPRGVSPGPGSDAIPWRAATLSSTSERTSQRHLTAIVKSTEVMLMKE
jgi:hypothetical protein